jgi:hypothetical protein
VLADSPDDADTLSTELEDITDKDEKVTTGVCVANELLLSPGLTEYVAMVLADSPDDDDTLPKDVCVPRELPVTQALGLSDKPAVAEYVRGAV